MRNPLFRNCLVAWMLIVGLWSHAVAQCPDRNDLRITLQRLLAEADPRGQVGSLQTWQRQWDQCGYPTDSTYISGLLQLGLAYHSRGELPRAVQIVQRAVQLCRTRRRNVAADQPAKALYRLGMLLTDQSQPAMSTLKQAVQQGQGIHAADRWVGYAYLYLAYAYYSAGDFQQAIRSAERGEEKASHTTDRSLITKLLQEKAKALDVLGQYAAARRAAEQAVALSEQDGYPTMIAKAYRLLGVIAENQRQLTDALRYRQRAFQITQTSKDPTAPDYAVSVGLLYYQLRQYDQAIPYFQYGVDSSANLYAKANSFDKLGEAYQQKKAYARALQYYQHGLTTMPIGFRNTAIASLPDAKSIQLADQKDYLLTLIQDKADTWLNYAKASGNNRERLQYALDTYQVADQMIDFMRWEHIGQETKLHWRQTTRGMYERAIETCYLLHDTGKAFRFMEKSRAVMLADKLNELAAQRKLSRQQVVEQERLQQAVSKLQGKLSDSKSADSTGYKSAWMSLLTQQDSLATFLKNLEVTNQAYYHDKYDNATVSLQALGQYLRKRPASFVTYFVGDSALYVMGITGDVALLRRQSITDYTHTLGEFAFLLAHPEDMNKTSSVGRFLRLSNGLYTKLLAPLNLPAGRVVVSPDGFFIPFDALSRSADHFDYAVNRYAFSYEYSASLLLKNRLTHTQTARTPGYLTRGFLGVAPVHFAPSLKQVTLPGSEEALTTIAGRFYSPTLLTHEAATRRAFLKEVAHAGVIQLFTHATADSSDQEPMLYFSDSALKLSDLGDNALPNAQLVVLAACKTGIGANQRGEGVFSLARGFAALGVPSVLTTLWSVQNEATYELTDLFYKHLDEGLPKDIALQQAKQDWLNAADQTNQLPNFWAGLILVGDSEPLPRLNLFRWGTGLLVLLIAAGLIFWKERRPYRVKRPVSSLQPA